MQNVASGVGDGTVVEVKNFSTVSVEVTMTGTATITWEASISGGRWNTTTCILASAPGTLVTTATATGLYHCNLSALTKFRARISSYSSGFVSAYARVTSIDFNAIKARSSGGGSDFSDLTGSATDAQIPNNITVDLATLASAATALAADPADCSGNNFALGIAASGVATCAQPAFTNISGSVTDGQVPNTITLDNLTQITTRAISDTTGTLLVGRGGTGQTTVTTNQIYVGTATDTLTAKTLPSCSNATTSKLLYDNATQAFSCGTDQDGGGGGGLSHPQIMARVSMGF